MGAALPFGVWVWPLSEHNREIPVRQPMEQSTDRAQQVIVTSRTLPRPRKQERIQKFRGDLLDAANLLLNEVPVQGCAGHSPPYESDGRSRVCERDTSPFLRPGRYGIS